MTRTLIPLAVAVALLACAGQAAAAGPQWATINICDSPSHPNAMGVRASIPGDGSNGQMFVRFSAEWYSRLKDAWLPPAGSPVSPWLPAGSARYVARQAGFTFNFDQPPAGNFFTLRGVAELQWRRRGRVVRSATQVTQAGVPGVLEGEPFGSSRDTCIVG